MGAALLGKGVSPRAQSVLFFGTCQVVIDVEPGVKMLIGYEGSLHEITHSLPGVILTVALCGVVWSWAQKQTWWRKDMPVLSRSTLIHTAWWSAMTHYLLDSMTHADMSTFMSNYFGMESTEEICIGMGMLGLILLGVRWIIKRINASVQARRTKHQ